MIRLQVTDHNSGFSGDSGRFSELLECAAALVPEMKGWGFGALELNFVDEKAIQEINAEHRAKDKPTDVLSFSYVEGISPDEASGRPDFLIGEIFICTAVTERQAVEYGHSTQKEAEKLFVHGLLHVFGYDHQNDEQEAEMEEMAAKIISCQK